MEQTTFGALWRTVILKAIRHLETALQRLRISLLRQRIMAELRLRASEDGTAMKPRHRITSARTGKRRFLKPKRKSKTYEFS